ncbi:MAG: YidC/Oxa1 family membrane protein insertase [Coriobacteriales bacterium]|nr:YidC/Oxa1 family membrane protein insertase [Coriobacteriales bacterium]
MGAWDIFKDAIFSVIDWLYSWCGDWGLAIILITVLFRILIYPITRKQFKSSYQMQKLQPKLKELREKYKDDPQRLNQETMKVWQEAKFNPLSGCLPMLLQMPIFIALYQVFLELESRVATPDTIRFYGLIPDLATSPALVFSEQGIVAALPYILMLLLFAASLVAPMLVTQQSDRNTKVMMAVMGVVMLFVGWSAPAAVLLYWDVSSYLGVGQQLLSRTLMQRKEAREELETVDITPVKVEVDRKERKARPKKHG